MCPNFNDSKYKYLESKLGELEAYKYWHQRNGDISNVLTDQDRANLIEKAKEIASRSTTLGIYKPVFLENAEGTLNEFADQLNSSTSEASTARKMLGPELTSIALDLRNSQALNSNSINAAMKIIGALKLSKFNDLFNRFFKSNPDKFYSELNQFAPKNQVEILKNWAKENKPTSVGDMIAGLLADASYTVEINIATEKKSYSEHRGEMYDLGINDEMDEPEGAEETWNSYNIGNTGIPTSYYERMTVDGGTKYTENEIRTPDITPIRQGHAAFSTSNGIGWFRSDDQRSDDNTGKKVSDGAGGLVQEGQVGSKTRRILEVQSDLFQKERGNEILVPTRYAQEDLIRDIEVDEEGPSFITTAKKGAVPILDTKANNFIQLLNKDNNWVTFFVKSIIQDSAKKSYENVLFPSGDTAAKVEGHETLQAFLQTTQSSIDSLKKRLEPGGLDPWLNERIASIQRSANINKKEAESGLTPLNSQSEYTISKKTIDSKYEFSRVRQNYYNRNSPFGGENNTLTDDTYDGWVLYEYTVGRGDKVTKLTDEEAQALVKKETDSHRTEYARLYKEQQANVDKMLSNKELFLEEERSKTKTEIEHLQQELSDARSGRTKLSSIANFYEDTIQNILKKHGYNPERITDDHGNQWFQVKINPDFSNQTIYFQKTPQDIDPDNFNEMSKEEKAFDASQNQHKLSGKEDLQTTAKNGISAIMDNYNTKAIIQKLDPQDRNTYRKYLLENLYGNKVNPKTTELVNNAGKMAAQLGRQDLVDMARLIMKALPKNLSLSTFVESDTEDILQELGQNVKAYYNPNSNKVVFLRDKIGIMTLESETDTVLHELLHGLTSQPWIKARNNITLNPEEQQFKNVLEAYYNYFKSRPGANKKLHAFSDPREFLMGALLEKSFQDHLKEIGSNVTKPEDSAFVRFFKDIFKSLMKLLGVKYSEKEEKYINPFKVQADIFKALSDFLSKMDPIRRTNSIKEDFRDYGLSFKLTAADDYEAESKRLREERQEMKTGLSDDMRDQLKKAINKSILSIKSFGSSIRTRIPESQEGFKTIFRQLSKLDDPAYNLDQIDYFFDFAGEVQAIFNVANDKISRLQTDTTLDPDSKLKEYEDIVSAVRNFDPILNEIQNIKFQLEDLKYPVSADSLNDLSNKRSRIESIYSRGVFPLITSKFVDILSPASKKAMEIANGKIDELDKRIALANKNNNKPRVKQLEKQKLDEQKIIDREFNLNSGKVESWLRGEVGDSNILAVWLQAGVSNRNPIVSGLSKFLRDNVGEIAPKVLDYMNTMQDKLEEYSRSTGRSFTNISEFNSPLIQIHKEISGKDDKGNYTFETRQSLLHEFNGNHIQELQKFKRDLADLQSQKREIENSPNVDEAKLGEVIKKIKETQTKRQEFINDYMEQKYLPEVHKAFDMLKEDLGGYTAWDYMGPILNRIEDTEVAIEQEADPARLRDLYSQLDDYNLELSRLSALYEKSPDSREYAVAQKLKERRALLGKYTTFNLTEKGAIQFKSETARMKRKLESGDISPERYERWLEDNTVTELTPEYWDAKKDILNRLNSILTRMGARTEKDETVSKLYNTMEEITKPHRDSNGIINGQEMTMKELGDVKSTEEQIEDAKSRMEGLTGLTRLEQIEASNIQTQINELNSKIYFEPDQNVKEDLENEIESLQDRANQISLKKKKIDKDLMKEYRNIIEELAVIDEASITKYYLDESTEQLAQQTAKVDISAMPSKMTISGKTYQKNGDNWLEITGGGIKPVDKTFVENLYKETKGNINYRASTWYRTNHISKMKYVPSVDRDESDRTAPYGEWHQVEEPTYAWKQTRPREAKYINENQPSVKYKTREVKEQYHNKNYKEDINGDLRPKTKGAKDNRFINSDYWRLIISNNPTDQATTKMLQYLTDTYFKSQEAIPKGLRPGYALPSIRKGDTERLTGQSLKQSSQDFFEYLGQVNQVFKDKILPNSSDKDILYGYNDDFNGMVPIKFIGDMSSDEQSIDLPKSILTFASEMAKREQLMKALPFANAVKDIANNPAYRPVKTKDGVIQSIKKKFLPKNTEVALKSQTSNTALQINEIIKSEIYGEQMKEQPGAKLVDTALHLGAKAMLGFNFVSSVQNYANAFTQSIMEAESKNKNFTMAEFFKAQKIYYGMIDQLMSDFGKYGNKSFLNQFFDYFGGINYKIFSKNNRTLAYGKAEEFARTLAVPNQITEHMLNYHMAIAIALHYRVSDGKGNMIPILNAFTLRDRKLVQKEGFNISESDRKEMIGRLNSSSRRVNGEYGDRILADKYVLGRMATFMNRYLVPFITKRYGSRGFNVQDGVREEGYWKLFGKLFIKDIKAKSVPIIGGWKYYTSYEKEAITKASTEFGFTVMFSLLIQALGGGDTKHVKDNSILENNLLYALKGIQQQNEAFMPVPGVGFDDMLRKIQNPFPILGKVKNLVSLMNDATHTAWWEMGLPGVDENDVKYMRKVGWHNVGDFKIFSDLQKLIGIKKIENYLYPDQAIKSQDTISRIK